MLVEGASYGGYLALSAAFMYGDRIKGVIADSAISNLTKIGGQRLLQVNCSRRSLLLRGKSLSGLGGTRPRR